jgi:hypothetical protein
VTVAFCVSVFVQVSPDNVQPSGQVNAPTGSDDDTVCPTSQVAS